MEAEFTEIDEGAGYIGYEEAFNLVCSNLQPVGVEAIPWIHALAASFQRIS